MSIKPTRQFILVAIINVVCVIFGLCMGITVRLNKAIDCVVLQKKLDRAYRDIDHLKQQLDWWENCNERLPVQPTPAVEVTE